MDTLTHVALGAVVGEATGSKQIGRHAMAWGAFAQYFPDVDVIAALWLSPSENLLFHRGITHSLIFAVFSSFGLGYLVFRWYRKRNIRFSFWLRFFLIQILIHLFIDSFNAYGAGLLEPFTSTKFSFNTIYVIDPLLTIWLVIATLALLVVTDVASRRRWVVISLSLSFFYLGVTVVNKLVVTRKVALMLDANNLTSDNILITPTPFNSLLWFVAAENKNGFFVSHVSVFDDDDTGKFHYFPRQEELLEIVQDRKAIGDLQNFSAGYFTVENWQDTIVFNDLRFGQIIGWKDPHERFVFHYYLNLPDENKMVMQRGRFVKWNRESVRILLHRMAGTHAF